MADAAANNVADQVIKITIHPPKLPKGDHETLTIVMHFLRVEIAADDLNIGQIVYGDRNGGGIDPTTTAAMINYGKTWLLESFSDESIRTLISAGQATGPLVWQRARTVMLNDLSVNAAYQQALNELTYQGNTSILSFYSDFLLISQRVLPFCHSRAYGSIKFR